MRGVIARDFKTWAKGGVEETEKDRIEKMG
jgi:hypothetical protein